MNDYMSLYSDARRYDFALGAYATGDFLDFYRRQIARYGEPVLELACGSGRLTIPLAKGNLNITGLDIFEPMLDLAKSKASESGVNVRFLQGDIRSFELGEKFRFILIAAQSLSHLHTRQEVEDCLACVRRHLAEDGRFLIELFNPSFRFLARDPGQRYSVETYEDPVEGTRVFVTEETRYDSSTQINHIKWFFRGEGSDEEAVLSFEMRQFFPQEIDALVWYNSFLIEHKYGSHREEQFSSEALKQLIVCRAK
jgi:SAM-dependent methyltransferase